MPRRPPKRSKLAEIHHLIKEKARSNPGFFFAAGSSNTDSGQKMKREGLGKPSLQK
jgi:hypothetical protein